MDVISCTKGKYVLQLTLHDKTKKTDWGLLVAYGVAHEEFKEEFLIELAASYSSMNIPYILGGDFNILRHGDEKNKKMQNNRATNVFNSIINAFALREIYTSGG